MVLKYVSDSFGGSQRLCVPKALDVPAVPNLGLAPSLGLASTPLLAPSLGLAPATSLTPSIGLAQTPILTPSLGLTPSVSLTPTLSAVDSNSVLSNYLDLNRFRLGSNDLKDIGEVGTGVLIPTRPRTYNVNLLATLNSLVASPLECRKWLGRGRACTSAEIESYEIEALDLAEKYRHRALLPVKPSLRQAPQLRFF